MCVFLASGQFENLDPKNYHLTSDVKKNQLLRNTSFFYLSFFSFCLLMSLPICPFFGFSCWSFLGAFILLRSVPKWTFNRRKKAMTKMFAKHYYGEFTPLICLRCTRSMIAKPNCQTIISIYEVFPFLAFMPRTYKSVMN